LVSDALAPEWMDDDRAGRNDLSILVQPVTDKMQVGCLVATSVQPDVQRQRLGRPPILWQDQAHGLDRAVDARLKSAHLAPRAGSPIRVALLDRAQSLRGQIEHAV